VNVEPGHVQEVVNYLSDIEEIWKCMKCSVDLTCY
jgi:hypothetical protein